MDELVYGAVLRWPVSGEIVMVVFSRPSFTVAITIDGGRYAYPLGMRTFDAHDSISLMDWEQLA